MHYFKTILKVFLLITTLNSPAHSVDTIEKVDDILVRAFPIGDSKFQYPEKSSEYLKICDELKGLVKNVARLMMTFGKAVFVTKAFRESVTNVFKDKVMKNKLCEMAKKNESQYVEFAKEVNEDRVNLIPIRQKFINVMVKAAEPKQTAISNSQIGCFFKKWMEESLGVVSTDFAKDILKQNMDSLFSLSGKLMPTPDCDWSETPDVKDSKLRSIGMLFLKAVQNVVPIEQAAKKAASKQTSNDAFKSEA